ncbi:CmcJ/NvfI family oxidoreductase [Bradyrhizobium zhanjiangense]|uniref:CmcJ/NvfI family oxidoreductase n=1 Tax=Bradyrhizobium zhanjiangense TaxID=1325107 RepID=UPI001FDEDB68|nr:CmcJ/NvfI family oxidoreductase [Bradyrhizobium zhanjiangense]
MAKEASASSKMQESRDQLEHVKGQIAFVRRSSNEGAPDVFSGPDADEPMVSYDIDIRNARPIVNDLSLDREGFTLIKREASWIHESDPDALRDKYLEEMVPFIKDYFSASWIVPKRDAIIVRTPEQALPADERHRPLLKNKAAGWAHVDYARIAGPMMAAREDQIQGNAIRPYSRLMIIQAWHVLSPPPQDFPLAVCDGGSVPDDDLVEVNYDKFGIKHKAWHTYYSSHQRWYYFPEMASDEFILFKGYDSEDNYPRVVHAAFDNRRAYPKAKPRKSVEGRFFVYYD